MTLKFSTLPPAPCTQNSGTRSARPRQIATSGDQLRVTSEITLEAGFSGSAAGCAVSRPPAWATTAARAPRVGAWNRVASGRSTAYCFLIRANSLTAASECPPRAKKSSSVPISSTPNSSRQTSAMVRSTGLRLALPAASPDAPGLRRVTLGRASVIARLICESSMDETMMPRLALESTRANSSCESSPLMPQASIASVRLRSRRAGGLVRHGVGLDSPQGKALEGRDGRAIRRVQADVEGGESTAWCL